MEIWICLPTCDADPESLLLGGTFCVLLTQGDGNLSLDLSLDLVLSTLITDLGWDRDQVLLHEHIPLSVLEADRALLGKCATEINSKHILSYILVTWVHFTLDRVF